MLSKEDNEFLCRVGPGTAMGELFRRFWLPALLPSELPEPDCDPVRIRLLGEDLIAFRDSAGRIGFLDALCPHRGAPLFFGRNEAEGLRCVYHGWKFDTTGACVDMPNEPAQSNFKDKIHQTAYPAREYGGLIWIYMGPQDLKPELPELEWARVPESHRHVSKWIQDTNYAVGMEGEIDNSHTMFLHSWLSDQKQTGDLAVAQSIALDRFTTTTDLAPILTAKETDYGLVYGARRSVPDGSYYWRIVHWCLPTYSMLSGGGMGRVWVPMDDEHTWTFSYFAQPDRPLNAEELARLESGVRFPPRLMPGSFRPVANKDNDFLIDRHAQRTTTYTGIFGVNDQDRALQENQGAIFDRRREHLGSSDTAVILFRRALMRAARQLREGIEPYAAQHGGVYRVRGLTVVDPESEFSRLIEKRGTELVSPV